MNNSAITAARHGNEQSSSNRCDQPRDMEMKNYPGHQVAAAGRWSLMLATTKRTWPSYQSNLQRFIVD
ncbi:hypothetical protein F2Q69_00034858 [Brassica cretica]|uniref:Uncharacterized protein n=1 Tax=Brassica cretica TaxID=69181 RepID=A0A8S9SIY9_BRACR|nr:hypothetical protein F2Q69_00034858 [Brassica cretica]